MSTPDLESRLRSYYGTVTPDDSTGLVLASSKLLEDAREARHGRSVWGLVRVAGTLVGAAILLAVLAMARFSGSPPGPAAGSATTGPGFDVSAAQHARVDMAGEMRNGGIWAIDGSYLLTSTDNGSTWRAGSFPAPGGFTAFEAAYVLDRDHAWALTSNLQTNGTRSPAVPGTVSRTSDGGKTWQSAAVSGDFECPRASMSFLDARQGFLMCAVPSTPGPSGPLAQSLLAAKEGSGTVLATTDGGATWSVAGSATGLSENFTASDATTLWSGPDAISAQKTGTRLYVSRNAGATWSAVDLPGLSAVPAAAEITSAAGPGFWDASDGAIAVGVWLNGSSTPPGLWFYRTSDAGRTWTVVKKALNAPMLDFPPAAAVGREWAARMWGGNYTLSVSSDFGATWTDVSGAGMPDNTSFITLDLTDKDHGLATVLMSPGAYALMLTSDAGRTWHPADFGNARTLPSADPSSDALSAKDLADTFEVMTVKDPHTAWNLLSPDMQEAIGSEATFASTEADLRKTVGYTYTLGDPVPVGSRVANPAIWGIVSGYAIMDRAYRIDVDFGSPSERQVLVVAPLAATGEWRVWIAMQPAGAVAPSPKIGRDEAIRLASIASGYADPLVGTVELVADGGPLWPGHVVWSVQFGERAGASSGAAIVYVDAFTGETKVVGRG